MYDEDEVIDEDAEDSEGTVNMSQSQSLSQSQGKTKNGKVKKERKAAVILTQEQEGNALAFLIDHPFMWDKADEDYKDKKRVKAMWAEVGRECDGTSGELRLLLYLLNISYFLIIYCDFFVLFASGVTCF